MFPSKISSLDELAAYAEGRELTPAGAALTCPAQGFVFTPAAAAEGGAGAAPAAKRLGAGAALGGRALKGAPITARGFSGMAPAASGATVVKSTLKKTEEDDGGARVQIDHVVVVGTGPDDACNAFEANPFKPESASQRHARAGPSAACCAPRAPGTSRATPPLPFTPVAPPPLQCASGAEK